MSLSRLKLFYLLLGITAIFHKCVSGASLTVSPQPPHIVSSLGDEVRLLCTSSKSSSICLWKTPYQAIYSVGGGRVWEDGRLTSTSSDGSECGLVIARLEARDEGVWQCEVGAVVGGDFTTTTADTSISIVRRDAGVAGDSRLIGLEGKEILIPCAVSGGKMTGSCRWSSPYSGSYDLQPGDYAERGRLQADNLCGLRVSSLQERDSGVWTCRAASSSGSLIETQTILHIETPLKLSAPTSILQQADERATLVCHANKQYETCEWETPYGRTVTFNNGNKEAESGRLQYFGFSDMDCGIVIKDIGVRDSGGWTCRVSASVAGKPQVSADIVRLFVEPTQYEYPQEGPSSIPSSPPDYTIDYAALDYNHEESKMDDYDAFDYVNGDFDKVVRGSNRNRSKPQSPRRKVVPSTEATTSPGSFIKIEEDDGFIRETQIFGKFGTVRIDKIPDSSPREESSPTNSPKEHIIIAPNKPVERVPIFHPEEEVLEDHTVKSSLNPSELDFLALISGSRVDNRPFNIKNNTEEFGSRQTSSAGSGFQFGNVQLVGENVKETTDHDPKSESVSGVGAAVPRSFNGNQQNKENNLQNESQSQEEKKKIAEQRQKQLAEEERERMERIRKQKEEEEAQRKRAEEMERKRKQEEEDRKRKERIDALRKEREEQLKREQQERDKKEREKQLREEREKRLREEREKQLKEQREKERKEKERKLQEEREKKIQEERERKLQEERERKLQLERERKRQEERERKVQEEREKKLQEEREKKEQEEREKKLQEEREKKLREEREKKLQEEREKKLREEREKKLREEKEKQLREEKEKQLREEREKKLRDEREKKLREEREKQIREDREKQLRDQREKQLREEREKRLREEREKRRKEEIEQKRRDEQERKIKEERRKKQEAEKARIEEEARKNLEEEQRIRKLEEELEQEKLKDLEERRTLERERIRHELLEQKRKQDEEERLKKIRDEEQRKIDEEKERRRQEEIRRIQEENEKFEAEQREAERKLELEKERIRQEEIESRKKEYEEMKRREEEEARLRKLQEEREKREREEKEKLAKEEEERKKKEEEELAKIRQLVEERRKEIMRLREEQAEKDRILEEERERARKEKEEEKRLKEQEIEMIRQRDKERKEELEKLRQLQAERERLQKEEREKIRKENDLKRQKEEEENEKLRQQAIERKMEIEELRALQLEREAQLKAERERIRQQKLELEKQQLELQRQKELLDQIRNQEQPRFSAAKEEDLPAANLRKCLISPTLQGGNITCPKSPVARGKFIVTSGNTCQLTCENNYVTFDAKEATCYNGRLSHDLYCVLPGTMIVVGGRSDTSGVLSSVELITSGGVCQNIIPDIPSMRWKMISASITDDLIVACGGTNFLGDPKTDCWKMEFEFNRPRWGSMQSLSVPRDAAAWAAESGKLYVMGGSLGTLSGYTASTEVYDPTSDQWTVGVSLTSTRASHCAVGDGDGHIVVTGGYGALELVQRLDLATGKWTRLADLQPVRAQHGCALVTLGGRRGVVVVGGDSGGTRLSDVRFLALDSSRPRQESWRKISDLNVARWGRPSVGVVGGRVTVIGGWDGQKTLNSIETYDEENERWETQRRTKLSVDRRWAAGTQISHNLFPRCISEERLKLLKSLNHS